MKILEKRHKETTKELAFFTKDAHEMQYCFPLTDGEVLPCKTDGSLCSEEDCTWWANYNKAKEDENLIAEVIENEYPIPAKALCDCGKEFYLEDKFYGSCNCPYCGRWYTLFGSPCLPPEKQIQLPDW